jgi:hypothetical protein
MEFLVPIVLFSSIAFIVKWSLDYNKWKLQYRSGGPPSDNSLGTSELKAFIREAVEEANAPLVERLDALEARLDAPARPAPLLDAYDTEPRPMVPAHRVS